ncbi:MAG: efflux RND transporter periplasmic adaptor subunit [Armatimonadetes bacterium]|nr:efflux RND transporter periplasmic adaptor subunit [Armatimonadota bacterium]
MTQRTALILAALFTVTGCVDRGAQEQAKKTQQLLTDTTIPVTLATSQSMTLTESLEVTGAFATSEESSVGPGVPGRLTAVYVRDGDVVRAGQAIAQQETDDLTTRLRQAEAQAMAASSQLQQALSDAKVGPTKSDSNVKAAQARLSQAKARYEKAKNGSRSEELTQAQWGVRRTKSDLETARAALDRATRLFAEGAIAKVDVETAQNRFDNAQAAYEGALQSLSIAERATRPEDLAAALQDVRAAEESLRSAQADKRLDVLYQQRTQAAEANLMSAQEAVRLARKALGDATIRSPFNGRVSGKPLQAGTYVAPGATVATIVGGAGIYFEATVPESKVARILPGSPVDVTVDALGGAKITGAVTAINPVASGQGRVFTVRVSVTENMGALKPGMFARGKVKLGTRPNAVVVPESAIVRDGENIYLFTVEGTKAKRVPVKLGLQDGDSIEVSGLEPGKPVVVSGQTNLVDGSAIKAETPKKGA